MMSLQKRQQKKYHEFLAFVYTWCVRGNIGAVGKSETTTVRLWNMAARERRWICSLPVDGGGLARVGSLGRLSNYLLML